ncbi:MAG: DUF922 domain-containing protein [Rhizobiaceae bacterium]|nr:DUF922 domain-containing protein [Rhizobiaceae bacterium]
MGDTLGAGGGSLPDSRNAAMRIAVALIIAALTVPLLSGWRVTGTNVRYAYYPVSGRNHAEIVRSVRRFAPRNGYAYGMGFIDFHPDYDVTSRRGECRITRADTGLSIHLKLPEWRGPDDAPASAVRLGRRFERSIRDHEMQHVRIAERYARQMSRSLMGIKGQENCWALRREARDVIASVKRAHLAAQKAFDRRTLRQIRRLL